MFNKVSRTVMDTGCNIENINRSTDISGIFCKALSSRHEKTTFTLYQLGLLSAFNVHLWVERSPGSFSLS